MRNVRASPTMMTFTRDGLNLCFASSRTCTSSSTTAEVHTTVRTRQQEQTLLASFPLVRK